MRQPRTDSQLRRTITVFPDTDGYVDALLGMARHQILARELFREPSRRTAGSRTGALEIRPRLH